MDYHFNISLALQDIINASAGPQLSHEFSIWIPVCCN